MSETRKKRWERYRALLKLQEPYEMTYWKNKVNGPHRKFLNFVKHLIHVAKREPLSYQR